MVSKNPAFFKQLILEEHWLSRFSSYLLSWGINSVVERIVNKYEWKSEEKAFDSDKG